MLYADKHNECDQECLSFSLRDVNKATEIFFVEQNIWRKKQKGKVRVVDRRREIHREGQKDRERKKKGEKTKKRGGKRKKKRCKEKGIYSEIEKEGDKDRHKKQKQRGRERG